MASSPITIGELANVPAPGAPVKSAWAQDVTGRIVHRFASMAERDSKWPAAVAGRGAMCVTFDFDIVWKVNLVSGTPVWQMLPGQEVTRASMSANVSVTATSVGTAQTIIAGNAWTYAANEPMWIECYLPGITQPNVANGQMVINLFDGAVDQGNMAAIYAPAATGMQIPAYTRRLITPTAGVHTYSLKAWINPSGSGLVVAGSVYPLGYLRVVKA